MIRIRRRSVWPLSLMMYLVMISFMLAHLDCLFYFIICSFEKIDHSLGENTVFSLLSVNHALWIIFYLTICSILCLLLECFPLLEFYILECPRTQPPFYICLYTYPQVTASVCSFNSYLYTDGSRHIPSSSHSLEPIWQWHIDVQESCQA